jgi:hypothetical protein
MAGWRHAVELAMSGEDIGRLTEPRPGKEPTITPEQGMHGAGGKTSLLHELAAAARGRILSRVDEPGGQFPGKALQRRTVLPDDGKAAIG